MSVTAAQPLAEAQVLLNDPSKINYTDAKLIPLMQKAYAELQTKMMLNGLPVMKEQTSAPIDVAANVAALSDGAGLPSDLIYPIEVSERGDGSTGLFSEMTEQEWEPNLNPGPELLYWNWREEEIKFLPATTAREVRIRYMKGLTRITATSTVLGVNNSTTFLAARTAALAAWVIGRNQTHAATLQEDAKDALDDLIAVLAKRSQGLGIRRRVSRFRRR